MNGPAAAGGAGAWPVALWQAADGAGDAAARMRALGARLDEAGRAGARLLVTPELYLSGYAVGGRAIAEAAAPADGALIAAAAAQAARAGVALAVGFAERSGGGVRNAAALIDADGRVRAVQRKLHIAPGGYEAAVFAPETEGGVAVCTLAGRRVAALICYDVEFPEPARGAAQGGAELIVAPTALGAHELPVIERVVPARAIENGVFVAYCNYRDAGAGGGVSSYAGRSRLCGPDGRVESAPAGGGETLLVADSPAARIAAARAQIDYLRDLRPAAAYAARRAE